MRRPKKEVKLDDVDVVYYLYAHTKAKGDPFPGLYEIRAAFIQGNKILKTKKVKEADNRAIASANLARFGGAINEEKLALLQGFDLDTAAALNPDEAKVLRSLKDIAVEGE